MKLTPEQIEAVCDWLDKARNDGWASFMLPNKFRYDWKGKEDVPIGIRAFANNVEFISGNLEATEARKKHGLKLNNNLPFKEQLQSITCYKQSKVAELKSYLFDASETGFYAIVDLAKYSPDCYQWLINEEFEVEELHYVESPYTRHLVKIRWDK